MWKRMWPKEEKVEGVVEGEAGAAPLEAEVVAGGHLKERQHQSAKSNRRWVRNLGSTIYFQPHNTTWEILHVCSYFQHGSSSHVSFKDFSLSASSPMTNTSYRRKSFTHEEELHQWGRIAPVRKNCTSEEESFPGGRIWPKRKNLEEESIMPMRKESILFNEYWTGAFARGDLGPQSSSKYFNVGSSKEAVCKAH